MKKKLKFILMVMMLCFICIVAIQASNPIIVMDDFKTIEMTGKYQLAYATGSNVYGYHAESDRGIYGNNANKPVRLSGDNGGRITIKDSSNTYYLGGSGNSSSSVLSKPTQNAKITNAYLMQIGYVEKGRENVLIDNAMTLKGPKGGQIKANSNTVYVSNYTYNGVGVTITDVTDFVKAQGFGTYQGWDIPYRTRPDKYKYDSYSMWRLITVCEDDDLPIRMLRLKMGSTMTSGTKVSVDIEGDGIRTKSIGDVTGQLVIAGGGGDTDMCNHALDVCITENKGSHYSLQPSPSVAAYRLSTGTSGNVNHTYNFFEGIVSTDGAVRSDVKALGYRASDGVAVHNNDFALMNVKGQKNQSANGHNAYFVNNSPKITLTGETIGVNGNLDLIGIVADIDAATYGASITHTGKLYQNADITMKAQIVNNTQANKARLGVSGGYAIINVDNNITLDTSNITAVYVHNGVKTTLPQSMITVNGNTIKVIFGANATGKSYKGDTLDITFHGSPKKEQISVENKVTMFAPSWIDENGVAHALRSLTTMATAKDSFTIAFNNPPVITKVDREFFEGEYTVDQWYDQVRKKNITATDVEDGNITEKIQVVSDSVNPLKNGTYTVKYQVEDAYGKTDTKTSVVKVNTNNPPVITTTHLSFFEDEITKNQFDKDYLMLDTSATDVEDGIITNKISVTYNNVNPSVVGIYQVVYEVTDQYGKTDTKTRTVTIKRNNPPVINGNHKRIKENEFTLVEWLTERMKDITATDVEDGNITEKIEVVSDNVKVDKAGFYRVTYKVTDSLGKSTTKTIDVEVVYNQLPIIIASNKSYYENELTIEKWHEEITKDVEALDSEDGTITDKIEIIKDNVDVSKAGAYEVTYRVVDSGGKESVKTIDITIKPNHQPVLDIFAESKRFVEGQYSNRDWLDKIRMENVTAHDIEDNDLTNDIEVIYDNVEVDTAGTYKVTYRVTDRFGKVKDKTIKVTVEPNQPPVIHASERWFKTTDDITDKELLRQVIAYDDIDGDVTKKVEIKESNIKNGVAGDYTVIYTVTDSLGKTSTCETTIHIETADPIPSLPIDPPVLPSDDDAVVFANGKQYGVVSLDKVMEKSEVLDGTDYKSVVFGVYSAEDIYWHDSLILKENSLVGIIRIDSKQHGTAKVYHEGKYYVQELATNDHYLLDDTKYYFEYRYQKEEGK